MIEARNAVEGIEIYQTAYPAVDSYWALDIVGRGIRLFGPEYRTREEAEKTGHLVAEILGVPLQVERTDQGEPPNAKT